MGSQPPALEKLFDEWSKKHAEKLSTDAPYLMPEQEEPYGGFVRDGIINLESWKQQKVRICFILNEAGGRFDMDHYPDGFDLTAEWNEKGSFSKFMFKLSVWTKAIQDAFAPPSTYKKSDVSKIRDDLIRSIAVVNIKKSDGQRHSDFERLQHFANEDAEELRRELEIVNPNIIICGENLKFLREPLPPIIKKKKTADSDTTVAVAEGTETAVAPVESEVEVAPAEAEVAVASTDTEIEAADSETTVFKPPILPRYREDGKRNYVFNTDELQHLAKFTYLWGSRLVFSLWTPANFVGTISSNTLNYYAVREIVRASLKAFSDKQKRQKIKQMNEQRHQEKLQKKLEAQQKKEAQAKENAEAKPQEATAQPQVETPAQPQPTAETPAKPKARTKAKTPAAAETAADKPKAAPKTKKAAKPKAE